ncbi:hypothetical protein J6590_067649 [Homalodisca vitripennis]|nr:hypothetical protein J6590_067649 [Homalodisca vitripennis]
MKRRERTRESYEILDPCRVDNIGPSSRVGVNNVLVFYWKQFTQESHVVCLMYSWQVAGVWRKCCCRRTHVNVAALKYSVIDCSLNVSGANNVLVFYRKQFTQESPVVCLMYSWQVAGV